jgi:hypothetical protein
MVYLSVRERERMLSNKKKEILFNMNYCFYQREGEIKER